MNELILVLVGVAVGTGLMGIVILPLVRHMQGEIIRQNRLLDGYERDWKKIHKEALRCKEYTLPVHPETILRVLEGRDDE